MKELKAALTEIVSKLEETATNLGAMEAVLIERQLIAAHDIDSHNGFLSEAKQNAKGGLANARYLISRLPE